MRVSGDEKEVSALYVEDDLFKGTVIQCENCGEEFHDKTHHGEPCFCPRCGKELVYRPWCEW